MPDRAVYILQDTGRRDLVKIGKDSGWPIRYSQALSQTPRSIEVLALWSFTESPSLNQAEKNAHVGLLPYRTENNTREWFVADGQQAIAHVTKNLGRSPDETFALPGRRTWHGAPPWDAWRDTARYQSTNVRRRLWVGAEISPNSTIEALKIVHSPYYDGFFLFKPTYACAKFRWLGWWQSQEPLSERSNRDTYDLWTQLVSEFGQGPADTAVGWLRHTDGTAKVSWQGLKEALARAGFVAGDPRGPKPRDARERDPSIGGAKPIPFGVNPPQDLVHLTT